MIGLFPLSLFPSFPPYGIGLFPILSIPRELCLYSLRLSFSLSLSCQGVFPCLYTMRTFASCLASPALPALLHSGPLKIQTGLLFQISCVLRCSGHRMELQSTSYFAIFCATAAERFQARRGRILSELTRKTRILHRWVMQCLGYGVRSFGLFFFLDEMGVLVGFVLGRRSTMTSSRG